MYVEYISSFAHLSVILDPSDPELANFENKTNCECKSGHFQPAAVATNDALLLLELQSVGCLLLDLFIWLMEVFVSGFGNAIFTCLSTVVRLLVSFCLPVHLS